jgi:nitroreductase
MSQVKFLGSVEAGPFLRPGLRFPKASRAVASRYDAHLVHQEKIRGSSIYPVVQNIILACRALGLGTLITTNHILYEDDVGAILGLPDDVFTFALMPIGYPLGKYGPLTRRPVSEVAFADRWGDRWPG